ncbi:hypothetical protein ACHAXS_001131, partial [Conticribra weissflogii]
MQSEEDDSSSDEVSDSTSKQDSSIRSPHDDTPKQFQGNNAKTESKLDVGQGSGTEPMNPSKMLAALEEIMQSEEDDSSSDEVSESTSKQDSSIRSPHDDTPKQF